MPKDEKTCPRCAEQVKVAAKVCKHCGHEFTLEEDAALKAEQDARTLRTGLIVIAVVVLVLMVVMCSTTKVTTADDTSESMATANANADEAAREAEAASRDVAAAASEAAKSLGKETSWSYETQADRLRGKTNYFAEVTSSNEQDFDFPYAGGSRLTMTLRKSPQYGQDVYFKISSGQFVCGVETCSGAISFDGKSERLSLGEPSDDSSDTLFATNGEAIIRKLRTSKETIVELPFYQEGNRQFTFETAGLKWPPKGS